MINPLTGPTFFRSSKLRTSPSEIVAMVGLTPNSFSSSLCQATWSLQSRYWLQRTELNRCPVCPSSCTRSSSNSGSHCNRITLSGCNGSGGDFSFSSLYVFILLCQFCFFSAGANCAAKKYKYHGCTSAMRWWLDGTATSEFSVRVNSWSVYDMSLLRLRLEWE